MKYITAVLLIAQALLHGVSSIPADLAQSTPFVPEALGEYSLQELDDIFDSQDSGSVHTVNEQDTSALDADTDAVTRSVESSLVGGINLSQGVMLDYSATCAGAEIQDSFSFKILYNGKDVTFRRTGNIDAWGKVKVGPIRPNQPITAEVPFHHVLCKPISRRRVCTYYFSGVAQASIDYHGPIQGITPNAAQPEARGDVAYVSRTCTGVPGANGNIACPAPTGPHCDLKHINVGMSIVN